MTVPCNSEEGRRIRWRCRRGLLELDCVLLPFYDRQFAQLSEADQRAFVHLLDQADNEILAWLQKREVPPDSELKSIITKII